MILEEQESCELLINCLRAEETRVGLEMAEPDVCWQVGVGVVQRNS